MHDYGVAVKRGEGPPPAGPAQPRRHPVLGAMLEAHRRREDDRARGRVPRGLWRRVWAPRASGRVHRRARRVREEGAGLEALDARARRRASRGRDLRRPPADAQRRDPGEGEQPRAGASSTARRGELEAKLRDRAPAEPGGALAARGARLPARPDGCPPGKFEIADSGVSWSGDGVLISAGSLHESGHVYRFVDPEAPLLEPGRELYEELRRLARQGGNSGPRVVAPGEPIRSPGRRPFIFSISLQPARQGLGVEEILPMALRRQRALRPAPERRRGARPGRGRGPLGREAGRRTTRPRRRPREFLEEVLQGAAAPTPAPRLASKKSRRAGASSVGARRRRSRRARSSG